MHLLFKKRLSLKTLWTVVMVFGLSSIALSQNIVNNPSFETYSSLPTGPGQWSKASSWSNVNGWIPFQWPYASPDYCHANGSGNVKLPNTVFGNVNAYDGNAVMGFITYYPSTFNFREYTAEQLSSAMTVGTTYEVSVYVTNGNANSIGGMGIADFSILLSVGMPLQMDHEPIVATPQYTYPGILYNTSWQLITFNITATQPFDHITFGNFKTDAATTSQVFKPVSSPGAYYFLDAAVVIPANPLPIELVEFNAKAIDNHLVQLDWLTSSEVNNDYFEIERSKDGVKWEMVLKRDGAGNSAQELNYRDYDRSPMTGVSYYRLKQTDFDGAFMYSQAQSVFISEFGESNVNVYPNPTTSSVTISGSELELENVLILNEMGQVINGKVFIHNNGTEVEVDLSPLARGIYTIKTANSVHKVIKK